MQASTTTSNTPRAHGLITAALKHRKADSRPDQFLVENIEFAAGAGRAFAVRSLGFQETANIGAVQKPRSMHSPVPRPRNWPAQLSESPRHLAKLSQLSTFLQTTMPIMAPI